MGHLEFEQVFIWHDKVPDNNSLTHYATILSPEILPVQTGQMKFVRTFNRTNGISNRTCRVDLPKHFMKEKDLNKQTKNQKTKN